MSTATHTPTPKGPRRNEPLSRDVGRHQSDRDSFPQNLHVSGLIQPTTNSPTQRSQQSTPYEPHAPSDNSAMASVEPGRPTTPTRAPDANTARDAGTAAVRSEPVTKKSGRAQKTRTKGQRTSSSPLIRADTGAIRPASQSSPLTSGLSIATPLKSAYAGPTFHASPAPSALPMPSFFSKSVPEVNSDKHLQALVSEDTSERSGDSPLKENAQIVGQRQVREESPLDIFFKADRNEKAERRKSSAASTPNGNPNPSPLQSSFAPTCSSATLFEAKGRQHSRHPTDGSIGGMFALEMDGAASPGKPIGPAFATPYNQRMDAVRSNTAPSNMIAQVDHGEEQRKAKTKALKMLLLSPQPQRPASASAQHVNMSCYSDIPPHSLSPSPSIRTGISPRNLSGPSTPALVLDHHHPSPNTARTHHYASVPFLRQAALATTANGSPRFRPPSSTLRQEVTPTKTPDRAELPPFPSLSTTDRSDASTISRNSANAYLNGNVSSSGFAPNPSSASKSGAAADATSTRNINDVKSMEDDLRRMLRMDMLGNTGAKDIRNGVVGS